MDIYVSFNPLSRLLHFLLLLFLGSLFLHTSTTVVQSCMEKERQALLSFKQDLTDPSGRLSSWLGLECCRWRGISCNNRTGHVATIDLRNPHPYRHSDDFTTDVSTFRKYEESCLGGKLNSYLLGLKHLTYLDLSSNNFHTIHIPNFIGQLTSLRYLNLSTSLRSSSFIGEIPPSLGNLSSLNYLDLCSYYGYGYGGFPMDLSVSSKNLNWLSHLSSLKYLNLGGVNLSSPGLSWLHPLNKLPSLLELHLSGCGIQNVPQSLKSVNFTSLLVLDISDNPIQSSFPKWFLNLTTLTELDLSSSEFSGLFLNNELGASLKSLEYLDLSYCNLKDQHLQVVGSLCNLKFLSLASNTFDGLGFQEFMSGVSNCSYNRLEWLDMSYCGLMSELPASLGMLKHLQHLDLNYNSFWGSIPDSIGNLSSLKTLDLSGNSMNGSIPESIGQLSQLVDLDFSDKVEVYHTPSNQWKGILNEAHFINLTRLESFKVSTIPPPHPLVPLSFNMTSNWVAPFKLHTLYIKNCLVGPAFSAWLQSQTQVVDVTLHNTGISNTIPQDWFTKISSRIQSLDLSYNRIRGKLPFQNRFPHLTFIDLSHNDFKGTLEISPSKAPVLEWLYLSDNHLEGTIPPSICDIQNIQGLSLRNNMFYGEFPEAWSSWSWVAVVDVSKNNLSGNIPSSMGIPSSLWILKMNNNNFGGGIPFSLQNCSGLNDIGLGGNKLTGKLPSWIGLKLPELEIMQLQSNFLSGPIPKELCNLQGLWILDLGHNNFSGTIPTCLNNLTSLVTGVTDHFPMINGYHEETTIMSKGRELEFSINNDFRTLLMVRSIDLSSNNLEGEVPKEICSLIALGSLNFSWNQLTGEIPLKIGNLIKLESFDASHNHLSGEIPQSISSLTFLSDLKLSHNNLSGRIPMGNQLRTLDDPSVYKDNPSLCGFPLKKCPGDDMPHAEDTEDHGDDDDDDDGEKLGLYTSTVLGFIIGFWGVCGTLILNKSWRYAYFHFFDNIKHKVALVIALKVARLQRRYTDM